MLRRIIAWVGLFGVLWHAGLVAHHRGMPGFVGIPEAAASLVDVENHFAAALQASMCRPGSHSEGATPLIPSEPGEPSAPCLACCCPTTHAMALPATLGSLQPHAEPLPDGIAWHAKSVAVRERAAERPPVRGPPVRV